MKRDSLVDLVVDAIEAEALGAGHWGSKEFLQVVASRINELDRGEGDIAPERLTVYQVMDVQLRLGCEGEFL